MNERSADAPPKTEQRRGIRFSVVVPVQVKWQEPSGKTVKEASQAKEVNAHGGLLDLKVYPWVGGALELTNRLSGQSTQARVVGTRRSKDGGFLGIAVARVVPSETFWGVNFELKKTSAELVRLEQTIKSGSVDARILTEFRDAVDYGARPPGPFKSGQERQLQKHDPQTVLQLLTAERIRRSTQLSKAIMTNLAAHEVSRETPGIREFFQAIESLYQRVADLLKGREA